MLPYHNQKGGFYDPPFALLIPRKKGEKGVDKEGRDVVN